MTPVLKNTSSSGNEVIAPYFTVTVIVPHVWIMATVIPLYKKGDKEKSSNYNLINLLPILSRIMEK